MGSIAVGRRVRVAAVTVALLTLAACSSGTAGSSSAATAPSPAAPAAAPQAGAYGDQPAPSAGATRPATGPTTQPGTAAATALTTRSTSLGTVVVAGNGMTVYQFDHDTQGAGSSACTGQCATLWPAVPGGAQPPQVKGVTGAVGTITGVDGQPQLTLNGWPLYYYQGDTAPGDTKGQGVGGIWWVLTPAGGRVTG